MHNRKYITDAVWQGSHYITLHAIVRVGYVKNECKKMFNSKMNNGKTDVCFMYLKSAHKYLICIVMSVLHMSLLTTAWLI